MATITEFAASGSGTSWTNAGNANADDGAYATYTIAAKNTTGNVNTLSNFGFDASIPAGSTINSVSLEVEHKVSTTGGIAHLESALAISGTPGTYNTDSAEPTTDTIRTYSAMARPGGGSWTRADLLDGTFTVLLRARSGNNATSVVYSWDYAKVTVDYSPPVDLGRATETDAARALDLSRSVLLARSSATDAARALAVGRSVALARATDSNAAKIVLASPMIIYASQASVSPSGGTTITIAKPDGTASGDVLIARVAVDGTNVTNITGPSGWVSRGLRASGEGGQIGVWTLIAGASEPADYTWTANATLELSANRGDIFRYTPRLPGHAPATIVAAGVGSQAVPCVAPSRTAVVKDNTLVVLFESADDTSNDIPSGMTQRMQANIGGLISLGVYDEALLAAGATGTREWDSGSWGHGWSILLSGTLGLSAALGRATETSTARAISVPAGTPLGRATETGTARAIGVPVTIALARATETSTARSLTPARAVNINRAADTDAARSFTLSRFVPIARAVESDASRALGAEHSAGIARALETDSARTFTPARLVDIARASETDSARSLTHSKAALLGRAVEVDSARSFAAPGEELLGRAEESDQARALTVDRAAAIGRATEADAARTFGTDKALAIGRAAEVDAARALTLAGGQITLGRAVESSTARAVTVLRLVSTGRATDSSAARGITAAHTALLGRATESDTARPIAVPGSKAVARAAETDTARSLTVSRDVSVGRATEPNTARAVTVGRVVPITRALEYSAARVVLQDGLGAPGTAGGEGVRIVIPARPRRLLIADTARHIVMPEKPRRLLVAESARHIVIPEKPRKLRAG